MNCTEHKLRLSLFFRRIQQLIEYRVASLIKIFIETNAVAKDAVFFRQKHLKQLVGGLPFNVRLPRYNRETEAAMQEAKDIMSGKVSAKSYSSARELFDELDAE